MLSVTCPSIFMSTKRGFDLLKVNSYHISLYLHNFCFLICFICFAFLESKAFTTDFNVSFAVEINNSAQFCWCKHKAIGTSIQGNFSMSYGSPLSHGVQMQSVLLLIFRIQRSWTSFIIPLFDELRYFQGPQWWPSVSAYSYYRVTLHEPEITGKVHWLQSLCQHTPGENLTLSLPKGKTKAHSFCSWARETDLCTLALLIFPVGWISWIHA